MNQGLDSLKAAIEPVRSRLLEHPVYSKIKDLDGLRKFSAIHVFAVWDFMSLLKSLQIGLTSVQLPWMPVGNANTRYLINEIVLGEESDVDEFDNRISHFELYLKAMKQMDASSEKIDKLFQLLASGFSIQDVISAANLPQGVKDFLSFTFEISMNAPLHVKAAVFTFGREDLIPNMFMKLLEEIHSETPDKVSTFKYYIERHIEVDGGHHSHLALEMVSSLCGENKAYWEEAAQASKKALELRYGLWDAVMN
jgi:hypothetical protein